MVQAPVAEVENAIEHALEAGYRHVDCSTIYQNEHVIGRVFRRWLDSGRLKRDDLFVTAKLSPSQNRPEFVESCLRKSLQDLQLDYVDMYLIHTPFALAQTDVEGDFKKDANGYTLLDEAEIDHVAIWRRMEDMVAAGLTRSIGVSNFNLAQMKRIIEATRETIKPANLQIECHVYLQQNELVNYCREHDILVTAYSPLGAKNMEELLAQAGLRCAVPGGGADAASHYNFFYTFCAHFYSITIPIILENTTVVAIAQRLGRSPAQILLRWLIERGISAIPKSTNPGRLRENLDVFGFQLSEDDRRALCDLDCGVRVFDLAFVKL